MLSCVGSQAHAGFDRIYEELKPHSVPAGHSQFLGFDRTYRI